MQTPHPPPHRLPPAASNPTTLAGRLPWTDPTVADAAPDVPVVIAIESRRAGRAKRASPVRAGLRYLATRIDGLVRRSPPFTVSLSFHVLVLLTLALLRGREEGRRDALVLAAGGSGETEVAVGKALAWLAKCQEEDGFWSLKGVYDDPANQENRLAATAMALLAFQGAGHTPTSGSYRESVQKAWKALAARQFDDGCFEVPPSVPHLHRMYSHAQATIAACELAGMTGEASHREVARKAVAYAVAAQGPNGGWRYGPGEPGDMSVTGWYVMALKSGEMAGLDVPPQTFAGVEGFLDSVAIDGGSRYGYIRYVQERPPADDSSAVSAEGLLARQFLGWPRDDERLASGIRRLLEENLPKLQAWGKKDGYDEKDVYAWYYITQVVHHVGGEPWRRWNAAMREVLPRVQVQKGREAGSWDPALDRWGSAGGRLFETCFCTWMLEVYYRHLPLYGEDAVAGAAGP